VSESRRLLLPDGPTATMQDEGEMNLGDVVKVFYNDRVDMFGSPRAEW